MLDKIAEMQIVTSASWPALVISIAQYTRPTRNVARQINTAGPAHLERERKRGKTRFQPKHLFMLAVRLFILLPTVGGACDLLGEHGADGGRGDQSEQHERACCRRVT